MSVAPHQLVDYGRMHWLKITRVFVSDLARCTRMLVYKKDLAADKADE